MPRPRPQANPAQDLVARLKARAGRRPGLRADEMLGAPTVGAVVIEAPQGAGATTPLPTPAGIVRQMGLSGPAARAFIAACGGTLDNSDAAQVHALTMLAVRLGVSPDVAGRVMRDAVRGIAAQRARRQGVADTFAPRTAGQSRGGWLYRGPMSEPPPESMREAARRGLEYRRKAGGKGGLSTQEAGRQGIGSGVARATALSSGRRVSLRTLRMMRGFFQRHRKNKAIAPEHKGKPWKDRGHVAWLLWGGDTGPAWVDRQIARLEGDDVKKGQKVIATGKRGGKIVGYKPDGSPIYGKDEPDAEREAKPESEASQPQDPPDAEPEPEKPTPKVDDEPLSEDGPPLDADAVGDPSPTQEGDNAGEFDKMHRDLGDAFEKLEAVEKLLSAELVPAYNQMKADMRAMAERVDTQARQWRGAGASRGARGTRTALDEVLATVAAFVRFVSTVGKRAVQAADRRLKGDKASNPDPLTKAVAAYLRTDRLTKGVGAGESAAWLLGRLTALDALPVAQLDECELPDALGRLVKGRTHKYIRRVPRPGGGYRYYYRTSAVTRDVRADLKPGAKFKLEHEGQAGHFEVLGASGGRVRLRHDESGGEMVVSAAALSDLLHREHAEVVQSRRARLKRDIAAAKKHGTAKQIARLEDEARRHGFDELVRPTIDEMPPPSVQRALDAEMPMLRTQAAMPGFNLESFKTIFAAVVGKLSDEPGIVGDAAAAPYFARIFSHDGFDAEARRVYAELTAAQQAQREEAARISAEKRRKFTDDEAHPGRTDAEAHPGQTDDEAHPELVAANAPPVGAPVTFAPTLATGTTKKRGKPIWIASHEGQIPRDQFDAMRTDAKAVKGWWSRGGWTFRSEKDAREFMARWGGGQVPEGDAQPATPTPAAVPAQPSGDELARRAERAAQKQARAVEKLRETAERTISEAQAEQGVDRRANTPRRARMAAGAFQAAARRELLGRRMLKVADAIADGDAPALSGLTNRAAFEAVEYEMAVAADQASRARGERYSEAGKPYNPATDARFVREPSGSVHTSHVLTLLQAFDKLKPAQKRGAAAAAREVWAQYHGATHGDGYRMPVDGDTVAALDLVAKRVAKHDPREKYAVQEARQAIRDTRRWRRMGIESKDDLRRVLAEYQEIAIKGGPERAKEDPIKAMQRDLVGTKIPGYFPTPKAVASDMVRRLDIKPGMRVLEPSAGSGHLARAVKSEAPGATVDTIEVAPKLRGMLEAQGFNVVADDHMQHEAPEQYDRILMNPPFEKGADAAHVQHAYGKLKPGGKMVAIMGEGSFFRTDSAAKGFRDWLDSVGGVSEKLPQGTFMSSDRQTGVNSRLVTIEKPAVAGEDAWNAAEGADSWRGDRQERRAEAERRKALESSLGSRETLVEHAGRVGVTRYKRRDGGVGWSVVEQHADGTKTETGHDRKVDAMAHAADLRKTHEATGPQDPTRLRMASDLERAAASISRGTPRENAKRESMKRTARLLRHGHAAMEVSPFVRERYTERSRADLESKPLSPEQMSHLEAVGRWELARAKAAQKPQGRYQHHTNRVSVDDMPRGVWPSSFEDAFDLGYKAVRGRWQPGDERALPAGPKSQRTVEAMKAAGMRFVPHGRFPVRPERQLAKSYRPDAPPADVVKRIRARYPKATAKDVRAWVHTFNSVFEATDGDESAKDAAAFPAAWAALGRRMKKSERMDRLHKALGGVAPRDAHVLVHEALRELAPPPEPNRERHPFVGRIPLPGGLVVNVENVRGSVRRGVDSDGRAWAVQMPAHYGELANTMGADGDPIDVFVGPDVETAPMVFLVALRDAKTGAYDEDKVFIGFRTKADALATYRAAYDRADLALDVRSMGYAEFLAWLERHGHRGRRIDAGRVTRLRKALGVRGPSIPREDRLRAELRRGMVRAVGRLRADTRLDNGTDTRAARAL